MNKVAAHEEECCEKEECYEKEHEWRGHSGDNKERLSAVEQK